jgi:hypothetical protein
MHHGLSIVPALVALRAASEPHHYYGTSWHTGRRSPGHTGELESDRCNFGYASWARCMRSASEARHSDYAAPMKAARPWVSRQAITYKQTGRPSCSLARYSGRVRGVRVRVFYRGRKKCTLTPADSPGVPRGNAPEGAFRSPSPRMKPPNLPSSFSSPRRPRPLARARKGGRAPAGRRCRRSRGTSPPGDSGKNASPAPPFAFPTLRGQPLNSYRKHALPRRTITGFRSSWGYRTPGSGGL